MPRQPIRGISSGVTRAANRTPACHQSDIRGHPSALAGRPGFGGKRHANAELAAQAKTSDGPVNEEVPIPLRKGAKTGEPGEY